MIFWSLAALLALAVVGILLLPLWRGGGRLASRSAYDVTVYKDQLAELERDLARGVVSEAEAKAARLEIERRLLRAAEDQAPAAAAGGSPRALALVVALLVPAAALGLYHQLGAPGTPSQPFAARPAPEGPETPPTGHINDLVAQLAKRMESEPERSEGWVLLARTYGQLGRFTEAAEAFGRAVDLGVEDAEVLNGYGEMLTAAAEGTVTPKARDLFKQVLLKEPADPQARYYSGLAEAQAGDTRAAYETWMSLAADTPPSAPWRALIEQQILAAAETLGDPAPEIPVAAEPQPAPPSQTAGLPPIAGSKGPTAADIEAVGEMSGEDRSAFIRSMVGRLAAKMEENPEDLDGWLRLGRAYTVLGEAEKARAAFGKAQELTKDLPPDAPERQAVKQAAEEALKSLQ